jgi:inorganic pyrophosphatase
MARAYLGRVVWVVMDRPYGSRHPVHGFEYLANYGYLPGTLAPDGEELDAYYLGPTEAVKEAEGVCIAVIHRDGDDDDKLVVVPADRTDMTDEEIIGGVSFQEISGGYEVQRAGIRLPHTGG